MSVESLLLWICTLGLSCVVFAHVNTNPQVVLEQGRLSGFSSTSRGGRPYFSFIGIPYGKVKRFEPAKPAGSWNGILDATSYGEKCSQVIYGVGLTDVYGAEDCLFLNVFVPSNGLDFGSNASSFPIIMFIHGGGFSLGTSQDYDPRYFMDEDIVIVTINYRLGAFGFLSTGDGLIEGNLGMKDQLLAIRWVNKNIKQFGGDPNRLTISGQSAGAGAVSHLVLSPLSKGLFASAIMVSGTALCPWALSYKPEVVAQEFAKAVNCPTETRAMVNCLKNLSAEEIAEPQADTKWFMEYKYPFFPSVEFQAPKEGHEILLPDYPISLYQRGEFQRVPIMVGMTDDEGIMISNFVGVDEEMLNELNGNWTSIAPTAFYYDIIPVSTLRHDSASEKVKRFYFHSKPVTFGSLQNLTNVISDFMFTYAVQKTAIYHSRYAPTFVYLYNLREQNNLMGFGAYKDKELVTHGNDLKYLFHMPFFEALNSEAVEMSKRLIKLWVSFATTGEPRETWGKERKWESLKWNPQVHRHNDGIDFYQLNKETTLLKKPFSSRFKFMDYLYNYELKFP